MRSHAHPVLDPVASDGPASGRTRPPPVGRRRCSSSITTVPSPSAPPPAAEKRPPPKSARRPSCHVPGGDGPGRQLTRRRGRTWVGPSGGARTPARPERQTRERDRERTIRRGGEEQAESTREASTIRAAGSRTSPPAGPPEHRPVEIVGTVGGPEDHHPGVATAGAETVPLGHRGGLDAGERAVRGVVGDRWPGGVPIRWTSGRAHQPALHLPATYFRRNEVVSPSVATALVSTVSLKGEDTKKRKTGV